MRRSVILGMAMLLVAQPALATRINNLDKVAHTIAYRTANKEYRYDIPPNGSVNLRGLPNGRMSLVTSPAPSQGGTLNGTGIVSKYIGNGRDQDMPVDQIDDYVIWPGGKLMVQRRMKNSGPQ